MRLTHQVCGQHRRYWPILSSRVIFGPIPRRGTAWRPRRWSSGAVDVVIIVRSREQSACISALEIACQTPRIGPAPAPSTGSSTTRAAHMDPAPLQAQLVANIRSEGVFTHRFEDPRKSPKRYKVRPTRQVCGQHGRYWPVLSSSVIYGPVTRQGTAWFPRRWSSGAVDVVIIVRSRERWADV